MIRFLQHKYRDEHLQSTKNKNTNNKQTAQKASNNNKSSKKKKKKKKKRVFINQSLRPHRHYLCSQYVNTWKGLNSFTSFRVQCEYNNNVEDEAENDEKQEECEISYYRRVLDCKCCFCLALDFDNCVNRSITGEWERWDSMERQQLSWDRPVWEALSCKYHYLTKQQQRAQEVSEKTLRSAPSEDEIRQELSKFHSKLAQQQKSEDEMRTETIAVRKYARRLELEMLKTEIENMRAAESNIRGPMLQRIGQGFLNRLQVLRAHNNNQLRQRRRRIRRQCEEQAVEVFAQHLPELEEVEQHLQAVPEPEQIQH